MEKRKEMATFVCKKCGGRASLWKHPDGKGMFEITCNTCDETTGFIEGMLAAVDDWKSGETHKSESVHPE